MFTLCSLGSTYSGLLICLVLIELFFRWGAIRANICWKSFFSLQQRQFALISDRTVTPTNHSSCQKTRVNDLSCGIRMWAQFSFVLSQSTRLMDGQTDRQTDSCLMAIRVLHYIQSHGIKKRLLVAAHTLINSVFDTVNKQFVYTCLLYTSDAADE